MVVFSERVEDALIESYENQASRKQELLRYRSRAQNRGFCCIDLPRKLKNKTRLDTQQAESQCNRAGAERE